MNTFYHGDCLFVMNHDIRAESIDLIYLDPPFFTGKVQKGKAKWQPESMELSFNDEQKFWGDTERVNAMRTKAPEWLKYFAETRPDFASYLFYMMERLEACKRVLKPTGSIYLHCDWRASHYLKMIMDKIFGVENFRNEIIWYYNSGARKKLDFGRRHDTIFRYSKTATYHFNPDAVRESYSPNINIPASKAHYYHPLGKVADDIWRINIISQNDKRERVGYPTQKPEALLERIILASSNEGDLILDPFCGCGTAIIAAHNLQRYWIGIDINITAYEVTISRKAKAAQHRQQMDDTFSYVERTLEEVLAIKKPSGRDSFEEWVNGYYKATKPHPDKGVDGITVDGTPIQVKTFKIGYKVLSQFVTDAKYHPKTIKPVKKVIVVSQIGFDDGARQRQFEIQAQEDITVELLTPADLLKLPSKEGDK